MSPIGRVFIVLNLALAGGFAFVAGNLLTKQDNWKQKFTAEVAKHDEDNKRNEQSIHNLEQERNTADVAKTSFESQLAAAKVRLGELEDDKKALTAITDQQKADLKKIASLQETQDQRLKAAFDQAKEAYDASIAAANTKDDAVRAKDAAEAENRTLKTTIASLNETIDGKNLAIAALERDNSEQRLLVEAAIVNGFSPAMAAPTLAGSVSNFDAGSRLCTIVVESNPGNVDIKDQIQRRPFLIGISDATGYKGDAIVTDYVPSANSLLCKMQFWKDGTVIKAGDRASTK
ncbi:MAG: hypothetical protein H6835_18820 [Planctomycetes bacterium]|nr:hypothetical protein [Planctomycetota bacterium]